ncbi:CsgE family curli-type amyloid fiber assembly protein [Pseudomonas sp. NPDC007930]|uniref:CsgE family curli-type amyloid fiber assembly protein n=1 Tax=Pseudomonas sp. NPDC007930 TaxID=3364417 RepID=UPI0036E265F4
MKCIALITAMALPLCLAPMAFGEGSVSPTQTLNQHRALSRDDVGGLVVGQTVTMNGRAFYDSFASAWSEKDEAGRFSVSVTERPTARLGSQVFINYGNRRMMQLFLPANRSQIPALGAEAAEQVFQGILDYQLTQFFGDPDLGRDEL